VEDIADIISSLLTASQSDRFVYHLLHIWHNRQS